MPGEAPLQAGMAASGGYERFRWSACSQARVARVCRRRIGCCALRSALSLLAAGRGLRAGRGGGVRCHSIGTVEVMQLAMFVGVMGAALLSAIWLIRERARTAAENTRTARPRSPT